MNPELKKNLIEDLKKTGFGSELRVISTLKKLRWDVAGGAGYFDKDENKSREIDVVAHYQEYHDRNNKSIWVWFFLVVEVKKSDKPWIVFRHKQNSSWFFSSTDESDWDDAMIWVDNFPDNEREGFHNFLTKHSLESKCKWEGSGIHQAFKDPGSPSRWYSAFTTVCKASDHLFEVNKQWEAKPPKPTNQDFRRGSTSFYFIQPLVVLDGPLFSAEISKKGELELKKIKAAPFRFTFQTDHYKRSSYRVHLIAADYLSDYANLTKKRTQSIYHGIRLACNRTSKSK
jgi:hypothetical protein